MWFCICNVGMTVLAISDVSQCLRQAGIQPTPQRVAIARTLLLAPVHLRADTVWQLARQHYPKLSRATVYNTLQLLVDKGLLRALRLDAEHTVYDSRTDAHSHIYHEDTGHLEDLPGTALPWPQMPALAPHLELMGVDMILRVRCRAGVAPVPAP